jgi:site-specific recombinase XerC
MLFDWLIVGQVLAINPAHAVRGPKHVVKRGKTPVLSEDQARRLLESIKVAIRWRCPTARRPKCRGSSACAIAR